MFTGYAKYKGRSIGRILHCLAVFCRNYPHLDQTQVGDGKVTLGGKTLATYTWPDEGDVPEFTFVSNGLTDDSDSAEYWTRCQQILSPFVDDSCAENAIYAVQCLRNKLTLTEALSIRWARDELEGERTSVTRDTEDKIKRIMIENLFVSNKEWADKHWWHFALCSILEI